MTQLAPDLFDFRYDDFVELGRSRLPALAPEWTDHNAHDPGITLMETLAWVAEAQLYALSRTRRDERAAYAALLGVLASGTRAARGILWADRTDPTSPFNIFRAALVIERGAPVSLAESGDLMFHAASKTLWAPGRIISLNSRAADGSVRNYTSVNERGGSSFLPFNEDASLRDVLTMEFEAHADDGILSSSRQDMSDAFWAIGVRAADETDAPPAGNVPDRSWLTATLISEEGRFPLPVKDDSSHGMMRTGALMLDMSQVRGSPKRFEIEFRALRGFPTAPRILRIEPNVLPITQCSCVQDDPHVSTGQPDMSFELQKPGLSFQFPEEPTRVEISNGQTLEVWKSCRRLSDQGPNDKVYEFDEESGRLLFGNGLNGRRPPVNSQITISYKISDGEKGNIARNRKWSVSGIPGVFGVNPDPISGGADRPNGTALRRAARRQAREDHALVSSADIEAAAKSLPLLEVARAWVLQKPRGELRTGDVTLIAMRRRPASAEATHPVETSAWLEAVRRGLAPRMLLGMRLVVSAPRYVDFFIRVELLVERIRDPGQVEKKVREALAKRLDLVPSSAGAKPREPGASVTARDVAAWIRSVDGVSEVLKLELVTGQRAFDEILVPPDSFAQLNFDRSVINAVRSDERGTS